MKKVFALFVVFGVLIGVAATGASASSPVLKGVLAFGQTFNGQTGFGLRSEGTVASARFGPWEWPEDKWFKFPAIDGAGVAGTVPWETVVGEVGMPFNVRIKAYWNPEVSALRGLTFYYDVRFSGIHVVRAHNNTGQPVRLKWLQKPQELLPNGSWSEEFSGEILDLQPFIIEEGRQRTVGGLYIATSDYP